VHDDRRPGVLCIGFHRIVDLLQHCQHVIAVPTFWKSEGSGNIFRPLGLDLCTAWFQSRHTVDLHTQHGFSRQTEDLVIFALRPRLRRTKVSTCTLPSIFGTP
jgi:hypothetical protein